MPKLTILAILVLCLVAIGFLMIDQHVRLAHARPAVQRMECEDRLKRFAAAFAAYKMRHADWPDSLVALISDQHLGLGANIMPGVGAYVYRKPAADCGEDTVIMWSNAYHAGAKAGDQWGGEGQRTPIDIPAVAYVLNAGLHIERLSVEQWQKRTQAAPALSAPHAARIPGHPAD